MELTRVIQNGISILTLSGNLLGEKDSAPIMEAMATSMENKSKHFVMDLKEMKYINSTGLSVLLTILTKSRNAGGEMVLVNLPEQLSDLLKITKLSEVFPQANSVEEAITVFKN